jgi:hypothetical protein
MKKFYIYSILFSVFFGSMAFSCEDKEDISKNCTDELGKLAEVYSVKANAFFANQSRTNCNEMKTAATNFFNKAKECNDVNMIQMAEQNLEVIKTWDCNSL